MAEKKWISMRARVDQLLVLGMVIQPLIGNPYNGYINPYGIGLMSLSPIIWKCHGSWCFPDRTCIPAALTECDFDYGSSSGGSPLTRQRFGNVRSPTKAIKILLQVLNPKDHSVDGRNPAKQLRLVVYPIIDKVLYIPSGCLGFQPSTVTPQKTNSQMGPKMMGPWKRWLRSFWIWPCSVC